MSYQTIPYHTSPVSLRFILPFLSSQSLICAKPKPKLITLCSRSCAIDRWLTYYYSTVNRERISVVRCSPLQRSARMAQGEHRRPPNQVRAPQTRSVRTRRCPSAPPTHLPALAPLSSMLVTARRQRRCPVRVCMSNVIPFFRFWDRFRHNKGVISCYMRPQYCILYSTCGCLNISVSLDYTHNFRIT